jgi:MFS family permease
MVDLLRQRNFGLLWLGGLISMTGDWMLRIALPAHVYSTTGSALATSLMFMASMIPNLLLASLAGVFVDRWDRRRTMVIANILLGILTAGLLFARSPESLWIIYLIAFATSIVGQVVGPAEHALLPTLVDESQLLSANALNALNNNLARLIGPAIGGVIALRLGVGGVALIDAATFLIAAGLIGLITTSDQRERAAQDAAAGSVAAIWRELRAGLRLVRHTRGLRLLFFVIGWMALGEGVIGVVFVPWVYDVLGGAALELGWLMSAQAAGGVLGGIAIARYGKRADPARILGPCAMLFGAIDLLIFNYPVFFPGIVIALVLFVLVGLPGAGVGASINTLLQNSVEDRYRGRVFGAFNTTFALLTLIGMGLAGALADTLGIIPIINVQVAVYIIAGAIAATRLRSALAAMPQPDQPPPDAPPPLQV